MVFNKTKMNRKEYPIFSGVIKYFPDALREIANVSFRGNEQHNKGQPLHWAREKSSDQLDALMRHLTDYAKGNEIDEDGVPHIYKVCWRALAEAQLYAEINTERGRLRDIIERTGCAPTLENE